MEEHLVRKRRGRPPGAKNKTLADLAAKHQNEPISDALFWQFFNQWWRTGGHPDEIQIFRTIGDQHYGQNPAKAIRQAIRYILANGLWG